MKKAMAILVLMLLVLSGCSAEKNPNLNDFDSPEAALDFMLKENETYVSAKSNKGDVSSDIRKDTAENGQYPYAVVITCSDSRVPPEHIFNAGIGELFVIRTAGNVIGDYELGSIEYGAEHLGAGVVIVLGHTNCGAVDAALNGGAHGYIETITDEISSCVPDGCDPREAEILNVNNSIENIRTSEIMAELEEEGKVIIIGAIYDIETGRVSLIEE